MTNLHLPGYYFDPKKDRYFKIEKSTDASLAYSTAYVKQRKAEHFKRKKAERYAKSIERHIRRSVLRNDLTSYGLLSREVEPNSAVVTTNGRGRGVNEAELGATVWAGGVIKKGHVQLPRRRSHHLDHLQDFFVGPAGGQGVLYTIMNGSSVIGCQIPFDDNGAVNFSQYSQGQTAGSESASAARPVFKAEAVHCPEISSLRYHRSSNTMLATSGKMGPGLLMCTFSPKLEDSFDPDSGWKVGESDGFVRINLDHPGIRREHRDVAITSCTPAPASSDLLCLLSTDAGLVQVDLQKNMKWLTADLYLPPFHPQYVKNPSGKHPKPRTPAVMFSQDFCPTNPNYVFAGGRSDRLWYIDLRAQPREYGQITTGMSIAYVKGLGGWEVLAAGLKNKMCVYDLRWPNNCEVVKFPGYKNMARYNLGCDVSPELNVVAASQDDGTVKLWSTKTGRRLKNPAVDEISRETPIEHVRFAEMPGEHIPSLWIGEGRSVVKYAFGASDWDDEA